jgi:hypothetical protein
MKKHVEIIITPNWHKTESVHLIYQQVYKFKRAKFKKNKNIY